MTDLERLRKVATEELTHVLGVMGPILVDELLQRLRTRSHEPLRMLGESFLRLLRDELPRDVPANAIESRIRARLNR